MHKPHNIAYLREREGLTQKDLADKLGVTQPVVAQWERSTRSPSFTMLAMMVEILNATAGQIIGTEQVGILGI